MKAIGTPISREEMFAPMLAACPTFNPIWQAFLTEWQDQVGDLPLYLALDELSGHICKLLRQGDAKTLDKVFEVIERWQLEGDSYVRHACTIGLFERIKQASGGKDAVTGQFRARLKPSSRKAWDTV